MPEDYKYYDLKIDSKEFVEQLDTATKRTRWTMIVLVLASVLIGIAFYNTTPFSFAPEGINSLNKFENIPINNLAEEEGKPMPLLDSYFGEHDFKDTHFKKPVFSPDSYYRDGNFDGLKEFVCEKIFIKLKNNGLLVEPKNENDVFTVKDISGRDFPHDKWIPLRKYLFDNFNPETRSIICDECGKSNLEFPKNLIKFGYLTSDLNKLLNDKYLYNERRFPKRLLNCEKKNDGINNHEEMCRLLAEWGAAQAANTPKSATPTPKTKKTPTPSPTSTREIKAVLSSQVKDVDVVRLNRLLLEEAFPCCINKSSDIIPPSESLKTKELATRLAFDDKVRYVNIPFFDTSIEINDLGVFGGASLIIILLLLRFSLSREIKNLNIAFRQSFYQDKLASFYHKLAMRLVLHVPKMEGESMNQTLSVGAKYICLLPILILAAGVYYDSYSIYTLGLYKSDEVSMHLKIEWFCVVIVSYLSLRCLERLTHVDEIWEDYHLIWNEYQERGKESHKELLSTKIDLDPEIGRAINRRVHNKSKEGSYPEYKFPIRNWGRAWFGRLLTLKNLSRLMPVKSLNRLIIKTSVNSKLWITIYLVMFVISSLTVYLNFDWNHSFNVVAGIVMLIIAVVSIIGAIIKSLIYLSKHSETIDKLIKIKPEKQENKNPPPLAPPPSETKSPTNPAGKSNDYFAKIYKI